MQTGGIPLNKRAITPPGSLLSVYSGTKHIFSWGPLGSTGFPRSWSKWAPLLPDTKSPKTAIRGTNFNKTVQGSFDVFAVQN